ncbi:MAG: Trafficking protein particle complex subunit 33 [Chrysothrix sp. TS-e1954]|nr:MAG: Trafficking protein particle complex subunit 33 [Chrysothrix sp. TS-e1954]
MADSSKASHQNAGADSDSNLVAQSCFDLLLIELVPLAQRIATQLHAQSLPQTHRTPLTASKAASTPLDDTELHDAMYYRLESLGYRVGLGLAEALSASHPLLPTALPAPQSHPPGKGGEAGGASALTTNPTAALDTLKFLCKDVWTAVFKKQIDNLKTNHRGVFVLTDNRFEPIRRCSLPVGAAGSTGGGMEEAAKRAQPFLFFPTGLIRGVLGALGVEASVSAEVAGGGTGLPGVVFTIRGAGAR